MKREQVLEAVQQVEEEGLLETGGAQRVGPRLAELLVPQRDVARSAAAVIAWLGGVLVAGSFLLLIAYNWEELGKAAKLTLVFGTLAALHFGGYRFAIEPGRRPALGTALTGAAMLGFGGAIGLVAQIYHLSGDVADTILAWWALTLPFALVASSRKLLVIPLGLFVLWAHLQAHQWLEEHLERSWFLHDAEVVAIAVMELGLGALLAALAALAARGRFAGFAELLALLGRMAGFVGLSLLAFEEFSDSTSLRPAPGDPRFASARLEQLGMLLTPAAVAGAAALIALAIAAARRRAGRLRAIELQDAAAGLAAMVALAALLLVLPEATFLLANALLLAAVIALVMRGVARQRRSDVNLAVVAFLAAAMCRYFEYVTDALGPILGFFGAGVLLIALGAFLERKRRDWTARAGRSSP